MNSARLVIFLWLVFLADHYKSDEITFVAPKHVSANRPYSVFVRTSDLDYSVNLAMMFREQRVTETLVKDTYNNVPATFDKGGRAFAANTSFDYKLLMKHNNKCHDKVLKINRILKKSYIFVQLDKPIYKPGDEIKFRIISLNNTLQPFKPENVNVTLFDPKGTFTQDRTNLENVNQLGLFNETFELPDNAAEGKWSIFIEIGKVNTTKTFTVQKYTLPFYEFKMRTRPKIGLDERNLIIDVEAVYSFGGFIAGNVTVVISSIAGTISRSAYIENNYFFNISLLDDLSLRNLPNGMLVLNITATFKDYLKLYEQTKKIQLKTSLVQVHPKRDCDMEIIVLQNYTDNIPYEFAVIVNDFDDNVIKNSSALVKAKFINDQKKCRQEIQHGYIVNSVASFKIDNPKVCEGENIIEVSFSNELCQKRYNVLKESDETLKGLVLRYAPPQPMLNTLLNITVYSKGKFKEIFWVAINRLGMVESGKNACKRKCTKLEFNLNVTKEMLPKATFYVFATIKLGRVESFAQSKLEIVFDQLSENYIDLNIPTNTLKPRSKFNMEVKSMQHSEVSLLAIDKSITALATGNDLEMSDFIKIYGTYDADIHIETYNFSNPRECTSEDEKLLKMIENAESDTHSTVSARLSLNIDEDKDEEERSEKQKEGKTFFVRSNFPETWFHETHNLDDGDTKILELTLPDTITTWIFTAFSLNSRGFALATPKNLVVKQDFFVKMNLPYAGRVEEILAVDAIVFNFLGNDTNVTVEFSIKGKGEIVERQANCSGIKLNDNVYSKTVNAKHGQGTKVTFNFLPKAKGEISFTLNATSTYKNEKDALMRTIEVVDYGIKDYDRLKYVSNFNESGKFFTSDEFTSCVSISAGVAGDTVSNAFKYNNEFINSMGCGEQTTSNFYANLRVYLYLSHTNAMTDAATKQAREKLLLDYTRITGFFKHNGAQLWMGGYESYPCLTSYMIRVVGHAMQEKVVNFNETLVLNTLNYLRDEGKKSNSRYYCKSPSMYDNIVYSKINSDEEDIETLKLANSLKVYVDSFILLGFLKNKNLISDFDNRYGNHVNKTINKIKMFSVDAFANSILAYVTALEGSANSTTLSLKILKQLKDKNSHRNGDKCFYFHISKTDSYQNYQISSYVALAYMALAKNDLKFISEVEPIVNWLVSVKTYGEPYNTAIAVEALTEAAKLMSKTEANYVLRLTTSDNEVTFKVNKNNWRDYQYKEISTRSNTVAINATGEGYLSVDVVCEHFNQKPINSEIIGLKITTSGIKDDTDQIGSLKICTKCMQGACKDMIVMEVQLQSGFVYDASLNDFLEHANVKNVEVNKGSTVFTVYLEDLDSGFTTEVCANFKVHRHSLGLNLKDGYVKAYVYNNHDNYTSKPFNIVTNMCFLNLF